MRDQPNDDRQCEDACSPSLAARPKQLSITHFTDLGGRAADRLGASSAEITDDSEILHAITLPEIPLDANAIYYTGALFGVLGAGSDATKRPAI